MTFRDHSIDVLIRLGYTERESQFLYLVATFSGIFLRRQFTQFLGNAGRGGREAEFLKKAISDGHIRELPHKQDNYRRYHLSARSIYRLIAKENSANRKEAGEIRANVKLRILEFVLDNFNEDYLEEEPDKTRFFTEHRGIGHELLPAKTYPSLRGAQSTARYFVDKFPLFISTDAGTTLMPVFTYFPEEDERLTNFPTHLNWYKPLFLSLKGQYKLIYVADTAQHFDRAAKQFTAVLSNPHQTHSPALLKYFRLRKLWEDNKLSQLSARDLAELNQAEKNFSRPDHEKLYQQWTRGEPPPTALSRQPESHQALGQFETYFLNI
jgi:hypothetical protein